MPTTPLYADRILSVPAVRYGEEGILGIRSAAVYNAAERRYSALLARRLEQLPRGQRYSLLLLRKYPDDAARLGVMDTPEANMRPRSW